MITLFLLIFICSLAFCKTPGRVLEEEVNIGIGQAEEVPISSFTLNFVSPNVKVQRALKLPPAQTITYSKAKNPVVNVNPTFANNPNTYVVYDELESEEEYDTYGTNPITLNKKGEGSVEAIPIESMRVRFEPVQYIQLSNLFKNTKDVLDSNPKDDENCVESCALPAMPPAMAAAAHHCHVELVFHRPDFPVNFNNANISVPKYNERKPRRLDVAQRNECGSHCVLSMLNFMNEDNDPDTNGIIELLLEFAGPTWQTALQIASTECSQISDKIKSDNEIDKCKIATDFMKCLRKTMVQHCPIGKIHKECFSKTEPESINEEGR